MKLRYIILKVKNLQRAKGFYIKLLRTEPLKEEKNRMVVFDLNNIKLGLYNPLADGFKIKKSDFGSNCMVSFGTDNISYELKRISKFAKIIYQEKIENHQWFEFFDSEGNILEVHKI